MHTRLDGTTWIGLLMGAAVLVSCLLLGHMPLRMVLQPEALIIVLGGTLTAVMIQFAGQGIGLLTAGLRQCLFTETTRIDDIVNYISEMAQYIRTEGMLAIQPMMDDMPWPMLRNGMQLMIDNRPDDLIHSTLSTEMEIGYRKAMDQARLFEAAGGFAPTMGIIGAVVGLIQVVGAFESPQQLTQGIASAFIATLYGVALSNLFLLPLAGRLRQKARDSWFQKTVILEGVMSMYAGDHPLVTGEKLNNFISAAGVGTHAYNPQGASMVQHTQAIGGGGKAKKSGGVINGVTGLINMGASLSRQHREPELFVDEYDDMAVAVDDLYPEEQPAYDRVSHSAHKVNALGRSGGRSGGPNSRMVSRPASRNLGRY